jgi:hypothetical protein
LYDHHGGIYKFTDQVVDHRRVEPLLKTTNYINGALTAEIERANNRPAQQPKLSCQEFSSWRGQAREKPMFLIHPPLAANTITAKSPTIFVQDECWTECRTGYRIEYWMECRTECRKQKHDAIFPCNTKKRELDPWKHKNMMNYTQYQHKT